jgi:hypothetical protein
MAYPDDENGKTLRRMESEGDDLTRPRDIDFTIVFAEETAAQTFCKQIDTAGYAVSMELAETVKDFPWDVIIVKHMKPSHQGIADFESLLQGYAEKLGGHIDGWGCFSQPS